MTTAFVHSLCYTNRPNTSKTHRSDDLFINAAIMQLNWHHDRAAELWPESRSVLSQCYYNGLSAPKRRKEIVVNVNRQLFSSYAQFFSF